MCHERVWPLSPRGSPSLFRQGRSERPLCLTLRAFLGELQTFHLRSAVRRTSEHSSEPRLREVMYTSCNPRIFF